MQSKNSVVYLLGCVFVMTPMYSDGQMKPFTDRPWLPQIVWDGVSIRDRFPNPFTDGVACNQLNQTSSTFFCDPNKILKNDEVTESLSVISTPFENATAGLIVISKVYVLSGSAKPDVIESEMKAEVESFGNITLDQWKKLKNVQCDTCLLLFVSCNDSTWYEAKGSKFLSGVEEKCQYLFNMSGPVIESNVSDCYASLIKPRMNLYAKLKAGKHPCQVPPPPHWIVIVIVVIILVIALAVIIVVVYKYKKHKQAASKDSDTRVALQHKV